LGALLAQEDQNNKERAIYYISRTLVSYEMNYSTIEKACLAVVFASQKLRHYMLAHTTHLIAKIDPLKYLLSKTALTGRIAK
ncbi:RNase H-like domain-containing protein, partial [[Clostridium] innocuum]|uniref:RNase H-like domain-containing protein n=1 Tax=Clostridium innocuum TaxID=1522 RepID=UPI0005D21375